MTKEAGFKRNFRRALLALAACAAGGLATPAHAAPELSPEIEAALNGSMRLNRMRVVAVFADRLQVEQLDSAAARRRGGVSHEFARQLLMRNARVSQQSVADELARNPKFRGKVRFQQFWIANAMVIDLGLNELRDLVQFREIKSVRLEETYRLIEPVDGQRVDARRGMENQFTYGLRLLNIPRLREIKPDLIGRGVTVGVLDTGIDPNHPDLRGRTKAFRDFVNNRTAAYDDHGHGTHCAGTIGGGATSGTSIGVAPGVDFVVAKGFSSSGRATDAQLLGAMQWFTDPDGNPETKDYPQIVSNSWGGGSPRASQDPANEAFCKAVDSWLKLGIIPVFAAGNSGPRASTVGVPAACPKALAVGATDSNDRAASFSSRGPVTWATGAIVKPDISAPGVSVQSSIPGGGYANYSGTSMATPHVAGLAALVFQAAPEFEAARMLEAMARGAQDLGSAGKDNDFGFGRIDALKTLAPALRRQR